MSLRKLPAVQAFTRPNNLDWDAPSDALARWADAPQAAQADNPDTITIFDPIGASWDGSGITAKRIAGALRAIGSKPVSVEINSPGGDFFEGLAIYNLLREHPAQVTVRVMGYAASAASVIAMAGDRIEMGMGSFLMIHNAWAMAIGNRADFEAMAATLAPFDAAMAEIYAARSGLDVKNVAKLMDAESWIGATDAIAKGLADSTLADPAPASGADKQARADLSARRKIEASLAASGVTRRERSSLISALTDAPRDARVHTAAARDAGDINAALAGLLSTIKAA